MTKARTPPERTKPPAIPWAALLAWNSSAAKAIVWLKSVLMYPNRTADAHSVPSTVVARASKRSGGSHHCDVSRAGVRRACRKNGMKTHAK